MATPKHVLEWYNAHYNNTTYKALRAALDGFNHQPNVSPQFVVDTMNLLTDAGLSRSGDPQYAAAEKALMDKLTALDIQLASLARQHLDQFGQNTQTAIDALSNAENYAKTASQISGDIRSWRGQVAHAWSSAAYYLLQAAQLLLSESHTDDYIVGKLGRAVHYMADGSREALDHGLRPNAPN